MLQERRRRRRRGRRKRRRKGARREEVEGAGEGATVRKGRATRTKEDVVGGRLRREPSRSDMWERARYYYTRRRIRVLQRSIT